jgi:hypothetical protein
MSPLRHWLHIHRHLRDGHRRVGRALPLVLGVIGLSLFASAAQVAGFALAGPRGAMQASAAPPAVPIEDANDDAGFIATRFVEVPSASADAISL